MESGDSGNFYTERMRKSCARMVGADFFRLMDKADTFNRLEADGCEQARVLYARGFDLFRAGCERVLQDPESYIGGHSALCETYRDELCDEYGRCLDLLAKTYRQEGRNAEAEECNRDFLELMELEHVLDQIAEALDEADRKRLESYEI